MQLYGLIDKHTKNMVRVEPDNDYYFLHYDQEYPILMKTSPTKIWKYYKDALIKPDRVSLKLCKIQILLEEIDEDEDKNKNRR